MRSFWFFVEGVHDINCVARILLINEFINKDFKIILRENIEQLIHAFGNINELKDLKKKNKMWYYFLISSLKSDKITKINKQFQIVKSIWFDKIK